MSDEERMIVPLEGTALLFNDAVAMRRTVAEMQRLISERMSFPDIMLSAGPNMVWGYEARDRIIRKIREKK